MSKVAVPPDTQLLLQAFHSFAEVSTSLERAYHQLQDQVRYLARELHKSNEYLNSILSSLPCGVLVLEEGERVGTLNPEGWRLLGLRPRPLPCPLESLLGGSRAANLLAFLRDCRKAGELELNSGRVLSCLSSQMRDGRRILVLQDVTEMRRLQREVQKAERLAAMGEMAVELAHEIRNPLAGLELFSNLLREEDLSPAERSLYLDNLQIGIRSLNTVLNNMFCFARQPQPNREWVDLAEILDQTLSFLKPLLKQRGIRWRSRLRKASLWADAEMMRQIFTNLILNALQALPEGGSLRVACGERGGQVWARVRDDGIGIPAEHQARIFDPHFTTNRNGNGLGLAIVHRLLRLHAGRIFLKSRPGWGTAFTIRLPRQESP